MSRQSGGGSSPLLPLLPTPLRKIGSDRQLMVHHLILNGQICVNVLISLVPRTEQAPFSDNDSSASLYHFEGRCGTVETRRGFINPSIIEEVIRHTKSTKY
jgi:hypothetical protein